MNSLKDALTVVLAFLAFALVLVMFSILAGAIYHQAAKPEGSLLFKGLEKRGHIEWKLDDDGNKTWVFQCPCMIEKEGETQ